MRYCGRENDKNDYVNDGGINTASTADNGHDGNYIQNDISDQIMK